MVFFSRTRTRSGHLLRLLLVSDPQSMTRALHPAPTFLSILFLPTPNRPPSPFQKSPGSGGGSLGCCRRYLCSTPSLVLCSSCPHTSIGTTSRQNRCCSFSSNSASFFPPTRYFPSFRTTIPLSPSYSASTLISSTIFSSLPISTYVDVLTCCRCCCCCSWVDFLAISNTGSGVVGSLLLLGSLSWACVLYYSPYSSLPPLVLYVQVCVPWL